MKVEIVYPTQRELYERALRIIEKLRPPGCTPPHGDDWFELYWCVRTLEPTRRVAAQDTDTSAEQYEQRSGQHECTHGVALTEHCHMCAAEPVADAETEAADGK